MTTDPVRRLDVSVAQVSPKTNWIFVEVTSRAGLRGVGEASLQGREGEVMEVLKRLASRVLAGGSATPQGLDGDVPLPGLPEAAAYSALDQALWDIEAQRQSRAIADVLGRRHDRIPLYANINRRTVDRSLEGFAASARLAVKAGHTRLKIAPFDEATPAARQAGALDAAIRPGLARIAATRAAAGPGIDLRVDCHWRLDRASAETVMAAAAEHRVSWMECPLPEVPEQFEALRHLRGLANRHGMRLAGGEHEIRLAGFRPFLEAGLYDVMMPDAKYAGGYAEMLRIADAFAKAGVAFSPHNPTGPVCHAASLHVAAAVENLDSLEMQFDETENFVLLQRERLPEPEDGETSVPKGPGLGIRLDPKTLDRLRKTAWSTET